ncbi:MAG: hypothetical protein EAX86_06355 [Candidatus Heimdallarchaeota archaeon]|nr:hypothetical protein [Candidatus Heimdallarchaeota archaeon]
MSSEDQLKRDYDQTLLVKESALDLLGHFSTAAAILAGFFLTAAIFLVSVNVERRESDQYAFLEELIGDQFGIAKAIQEALPTNFVELYWPTHFSYMLTIFIVLFLMAMFSYACYIQAGLAHMKVLEGKTLLLDRVWWWQKWGLRILIIDLFAAFITLPWAILRFAFEHAFTWTLTLLCGVLICGIILGIGVKVARRRK